MSAFHQADSFNHMAGIAMGTSLRNPPRDLYIDPNEAGLARTAKLLYTVVGSPSHDNEGHFECGRRMTSILTALASHKLLASDHGGEVRRAGQRSLNGKVGKYIPMSQD